MGKLFANSGDPDQTLHSAASDLGLHLVCQLLFYGSPTWVNCSFPITWDGDGEIRKIINAFHITRL